MTDVILTGACGRMGRAIAEAAASADARIVAGVDRFCGNCDFPLFTYLEQVETQADVLVDFTVHTATQELIAFAERTGTPLVIATTGHTEEEMNALVELSKRVAVFHSGNMSVGINLMISLCRNITAAVGGRADIEIIEKHHNKKLDAPSGTALMIANAIREASSEDLEYVYDRTGRREIRPEREIGISAIRGGNIVGEHEVMFCMGNEILSVKHTAIGRALFAEGALRAATYMKGKTTGFYTMEDLLQDAIEKTAILT